MNPIKKYYTTRKMGIDLIRDTDIFVVSYPKSGNTWVRFLIANLLTKNETITFQNINEYVPGIYAFAEKINRQQGQRFIKSHTPSFELFPKCIYIYRDYRDVLVSYYHFQIGQQQFEGTFSDFIRSKNTETFGNWKQHIQQALQHKKKHPDRILLISYEQLKKEPEPYVRDIAGFCSISPKRSWKEIVENCSFESLKRTEEKYGRVFDTPNLQFFRSGTSGHWEKVFSDDDLEYVMKDNKETLLQLGYDVD